MSPRPLAAHLNRLIWFSLLPLLLIAAWLAVDRVRTDQLEMEEAAQRRLSNDGARIDDFVETRILALKLLAASPLADNPRRLSDLYAEAQAFSDNLGSHLIVADATGRMLLNTRALLGTTLPHIPDDPDHATNRALATGQPAVSNLFIGQLTQQPMLAIAVPGMRAGEVRHLMLTTFTAEQIQQQLAQVAVQPGWMLTLSDGNGKLIARQAPPGFDPERDVDPRWRFEQQLRFAPWTVRVEIPRQVQRGPLIEFALLLALGIALATVAGMLGSARIARRIDRQVASLVDPAASDSAPDEVMEIAATRQRIDAAQAELRASEARFRNLAEYSADWIWTLDLNGHHTYSNANIGAILGYSANEFLTADPVTLVHPDDLAKFGATFEHACASRTGWRNVVIRWRHKDGDYRLLESSAAPAMDAQGKLQGFQGVDRDITERVQTEQERARLASILEVTSDIVSMSDPQGHIIYLNGPGRTLLGIEPEGALPEVISKVHPQWATDIILGEGLPTAIQAGTWSGETAILGPGGQEIPVSQVILTHKDKQGKLLFLSTIMRDIRESRAAAQALRDLNATLEARVAQRTAELTAANQELESFAYAVSHDLRAPLRAMSGFSVALQEDFGDTLTGDAKRYLDQIDLASRRMSDLIDGLLTLSRSARGELRRDPVDLSALALRRLERLAHSEPQRLVTTEVEPGLHALGDARMLEVVIGNLIDNAWKYTARTIPAQIRVHAGTVHGVRGFCVSDNGAGFDMAHAARLFQPFQRLHRQEEFPGTGIGLATVQRIVHRHGGEIVAQGKPGEGASFCFTLPASGLEKP